MAVWVVLRVCVKDSMAVSVVIVFVAVLVSAASPIHEHAVAIWSSPMLERLSRASDVAHVVALALSLRAVAFAFFAAGVVETYVVRVVLLVAVVVEIVKRVVEALYAVNRLSSACSGSGLTQSKSWWSYMWAPEMSTRLLQHRCLADMIMMSSRPWYIRYWRRGLSMTRSQRPLPIDIDSSSRCGVRWVIKQRAFKSKFEGEVALTTS